jgi:hypothetical protein
MHLILGLLSLSFILAPVSAQNMTNLTTVGNLQSARPAPLRSLAEATSRDTPVDLFALASSKIKEGDFAEASLAMFVASAYGAFDTMRVADPTAHQGLSVLMMGVSDGLSEEQSSSFREFAVNFVGDGSALREYLLKLGPPSYHPDYMIKHGMGAFTDPSATGLVEGFDTSSAWEKILSKIGN